VSPEKEAPGGGRRRSARLAGAGRAARAPPGSQRGFPNFRRFRLAFRVRAGKNQRLQNMQTQDAPAEIIFKLWPWLEANKKRLIGAAAAVVVVAGILYFISAQRQQREVDAGQALTQLLMNLSANNVAGPKSDAFAKLAAEYPGTAAGERAQLQAAAALFDSGRYADAQAQFQKFLEGGFSGPLVATAQLGLAASLEAQNKLEPATAAYQRVLSGFAGSASALPAELALGRIAEQQNKLTEAVSHYENVARTPLGGSLAQEAAMRASEIKTKLAATKPAMVVSTNTVAAPKPAAPATAAKP
jgi:predicted negative regulator of RcsB-dependent stress response